MLSLLPYERKIMQMLLAGDHPNLEILRKQLSNLEVSAREFTGVGFYTDFQVHACPLLPPEFNGTIIDDVHGEIETIEHDCATILFTEEGKLHLLECYSIEGEAFPDHPNFSRLYYAYQPNLTMEEAASQRDMEYMRAILGPKR